jgi:preprotein translocase SecE subunit
MAKAKAAKTTKEKVKNQPKKSQPRASSGLFGYFKNSWRELRLVRWPNRRATWSFTFAVLLFSAFFMLVILGLDAGFEFLFKRFVL